MKIINIKMADISPLTNEQKESIKKASQKPIIIDSDCPEINSSMKKASVKIIKY